MIRHLAAAAGAGFALSLVGIGSVATAAEPGQAAFMANCAACHQASGAGVPGAFPGLKGSRLVQGDPRLLAQMLLYGRGAMPAFKDALSDRELAEIANYVRTAWGNSGSRVSPELFAKGRGCKAPACR